MHPDSPWHVERVARNTEAAIGEQRRAGIRDSLRYHAARPSGNSRRGLPNWSANGIWGGR